LLKLEEERKHLGSEEPQGHEPGRDRVGLETEIEERLQRLDADVEVLAVDVIRARRAPTLRIFLDRPGGVDLDLCARATHELRDLLRDYTVEVSSPGPERPLSKPEHYRRFTGRRVRVRTSESIDGRNDFKGELIGVDDDGVALAGEWGTVTIPRERIRRSNLIAQTQADPIGQPGKIGRRK
jgi:ribosome maturation factor RimP